MVLLAVEFPITPEVGIFFWTTLVFLIVWLFLGRFAFKPIQNALKKRENDIQDALDEAKKARDEMANLKAENEALLAQAQEERSKILKEAKEAKDSIIAQAKESANSEYKTILQAAKEDIQNQKMAAITDLKNQVGLMSVEIAEKILTEKLSGDQAQENFVNKLVEEIKLN